MITLIHGDDITASRNFLNQLRSKSRNVVLLDGEKSQIEDVVQNVSGTSLFEDPPTIIIENLLVGKKKRSLQDQIVSYLKANKEANVIIWEDSVVSKTASNRLPDAKIHEFSLPKSLFTFLDSITPHNPSLISLYHQALESSEPELLFFMIVRQIRLLMAVSDPSSDQIDEAKRLAPWQMSKLQRQAQRFGMQKLIETHKKLFSIEKGMKTGGLTASLSQTIDFFLTDL